MIDPKLPLFYRNTGRPAEIIDTIPLVAYRVRYSNGGEETLNSLELEQKLTNERPRYQFTLEANPRMQVAGKKDTVRFGIRRPSSFSDGVAQDLSLEQVRKLSEELAQWVQDRE
jgi:hypothetical protein